MPGPALNEGAPASEFPRPADHYGDLPGALLDGAEALVRERGVADWSLRQLSEQLGVSSSAVYHHFAFEEAIVLALASRALSRLGGRAEDRAGAGTGPGPYDRMVAFGRGYVRWALREPALFRLAFGPDRSYTGSPVNRSPSDLLTGELDRLVARGALPAAALPHAENHIWSAVHGLAKLVSDGALNGRSPQTLDTLAAHLTRTVLLGLAAEHS